MDEEEVVYTDRGFAGRYAVSSFKRDRNRLVGTGQYDGWAILVRWGCDLNEVTHQGELVAYARTIPAARDYVETVLNTRALVILGATDGWHFDSFAGYSNPNVVMPPRNEVIAYKGFVMPFVPEVGFRVFEGGRYVRRNPRLRVLTWERAKKLLV